MNDQRTERPDGRPAPALRDRKAGAVIDGDSFRLRNLYRVQPGSRPSSSRYIVCADINRIYSGLGCLLLILAPCWRYARKTGRTLVIDWRGNPYTRGNPNRNLFPLLFEEPDSIGVPCIADDSINDLDLPQPILGPADGAVDETGAPVGLPDGGMAPSEMLPIIERCIDVVSPTVLPPLKVTYGLAARNRGRGFRPIPGIDLPDGERLYGNLRLRPQWSALVSDFFANNMAGRPAIGIHIRHGNGEAAYRDHFRKREFGDFPSFVTTLAAGIRRYASERFGSNYTVFLATDSNIAVEAMQPHFTSLVSRPIWRPAAGEGVDFDHAFDRDDGGVGAAADAIIDMQLLAKCDAVFMTRHTSFASHVPYIMEKPGARFFDHRLTARMFGS